MEISPEIDKKCDELIARYPRKKSAAMLILHLIQEKLGYFDDDAIKFAAGKLGVRPIEVYGMISFYPMFTTAPRGRIHIKVCRTLSCAMAGSVKLGHDKLFENVAPEEADKFIEKISAMDADGSLAPAPFDAEPNAEGDFESPAYKG